MKLLHFEKIEGFEIGHKVTILEKDYNNDNAVIAHGIVRYIGENTVAVYHENKDLVIWYFDKEGNGLRKSGTETWIELGWTKY